jgi:hypothetical protein
MQSNDRTANEKANTDILTDKYSLKQAMLQKEMEELEPERKAVPLFPYEISKRFT